MTIFDALFEGFTQGLFEIGFKRQAWRFLAVLTVALLAYFAFLVFRAE
jgi:type II secretory pathway component PulF